jgi:hypothetical protein
MLPVAARRWVLTDNNCPLDVVEVLPPLIVVVVLARYDLEQAKVVDQGYC